MKHITKISTLLIALTLAMSANAATQYCEKNVQSNQGESGTLTFTASKTGEKETTFILTTNTSNNFRALDVNGTLFNVVLQDPGQGSTSTIWREGWTLENNTLTKVVTWTTYPTNPIRLLIVANRDNSKGGSDIIGAEFADIDVSVSCDGSGDSGDSGDSDLPIPSTGPSNVNWENYAWVPKNQCETCENQYKVETNSDCVKRAENILDKNQNMSIYCVTAQVVTACNIACTLSAGTEIWLHLSDLTSRETEVTLKFADGSTCSFWVLNDKAEPADDPDQPVEEGVCTYEGGPGDALMEQPGKDQFKSGYRITLTLDEADTDKIHITATVFGEDVPASTAWFQNYPNYNYSQNTAQQQFAVSSQNSFETTISISSLISNRDDGIIRFAIKFEYPDGVIKVTTPEYFYLDGSGCAQRVFAIYHHDDLPATPLEGEDQFTEFAGGRILQSIQYKRRMPSEVWETLSVPFDVDRVTAFDPATGEHVPLHAQYNHNGATQAGNYWLRSFQTSSVTRDNFQANWQDISATSADMAKPEKDKAYIIRLPNGGGYYNDKYIVFHGRGYQTIANTYNVPDPPADDYYSYSGNNTMMPQDLSSAYVLDNAGYYFTSSSSVTLPPFECSVNATAATIAKMPRIALNGRNNTTTDLTLLPTTDLQGGVIYSIFGAAVARFNTIDEYDQACQTLASGVYVIVTPSTTTKIQIP